MSYGEGSPNNAMVHYMYGVLGSGYCGAEGDGTKLTWKRAESGRTYLLPLLICPLLMLYGYRGE